MWALLLDTEFICGKYNALRRKEHKGFFKNRIEQRVILSLSIEFCFQPKVEGIIRIFSFNHAIIVAFEATVFQMIKYRLE